MKNRKSIYVLLPIVLLIWGILINQFLSFSVSDTVLKNTTSEFSIKPFKLKERNQFYINVNYKDPFLGKIHSPQIINIPKNTIKAKNKPKTEEIIDWPTILYKGIVSDTKDKKRIYMLVINGKTCLMKKGSTENEVHLKDGDKESIYVKYKGALNLIMLAE